MKYLLTMLLTISVMKDVIIVEDNNTIIGTLVVTEQDTQDYLKDNNKDSKIYKWAHSLRVWNSYE